MADMNKAFFLAKEARDPQWRIIDANGKPLGRMATRIADMLRGKDKPTYTPHTDGGDYIIVINADKVMLTGDKWNDPEWHVTYSGWIGGQKFKSAKDLSYEKLITLAVKGMLPKNKLSDQMIKKLKIYEGEVHPHGAHKPVMEAE
jgi:large subunit ribosomal protein L13